MADNGDSRAPLTSFVGPGLIVIIGGLVAYFTYEPALQSRRPEQPQNQSVPPPPSPPHLYAVHSRLWDDPLAVAYQHSVQASAEAGDGRAVIGSPWVGQGRVDSDARRYFRNIVTSCLENAAETGAYLCLPVMIRGEPYADDTESRKRITYAVFSALETCGYELNYPERLSYVKATVWADLGDLGWAPVEMVVPVKAFRRADVPGAASPNHEGPAGVLVLWINERQLGNRPLDAIGQVLEGLLGSVLGELKKKTAVRILGPSDSDTLLAMAKEAAMQPKPAPTRSFGSWNSVELYSGNATLWPHVLGAAASANPESAARNPVLEFLAKGVSEKDWKLNVVCTIGSDMELIRAIAHELFLRDAWPLAGDPAKLPNSAPLRPGKHLVLVAESDTSYGSAVAAAFRREFPQLVTDSELGNALGNAADGSLLHVFTYLRGLDGKLPEKNGEGDDATRDDAKQEKNKSDSVESDFDRSRNLEQAPAHGRPQLDYLRRLQQHLLELDAQLQTKGQAGIAAIGMVGTDIYDKLLILRSLRKHFPNAWFFSTDLDAELNSAGEYPSTHNLLVATHFGLTLHPKLQRTAPPFRDTYQTAAFFSTLLALQDQAVLRGLQAGAATDIWGWKTESSAQRSKGRFLQPVVFEIGRRGAYQLTIPEEDGPLSAQIHPPGPRQPHWLTDPFKATMAVLAAACLVLAGTSVWTTREHALGVLRDLRLPTRRRPARGGSLAPLALVVMAAVGTLLALLYVAARDHVRVDGEPFVVFDGISIWPATIVRFVAGAFSVCCVAKLARDGTAGVRDSLDRCGAETTTSGACSAAYAKYKRVGAGWPALASALPPTLLLCGFGLCLVSVTQGPFLPYRGGTSAWWGRGTLMFAVGAMTYFTFFVVCQLEACSQFIARIARSEPDWSFQAMRELVNGRRRSAKDRPREGDREWRPAHDPDSGESSTIDVAGEAASSVGSLILRPASAVKMLERGAERPAAEKRPQCDGGGQPAAAHDDLWREALTIDVIAEATQRVGGRIKYPVLAVLLIILSRQPAFSSANLNLTLSLVILWALMCAGLFFAAWKLRRTAGQAREQALGRLRDGRSRALAAEQGGGARVQLIDQQISEIEQESRGAFQHWLQDPLANAITVLLGGAGGMHIVDYLLPYL